RQGRMSIRWRMNLLSLDDEEAETLGINTKRTRLIFILSATLMTSAAVSITGIIGWVGLIIPHIARLWIGADFRRLLPTSLFIGATFLLLTDTIARSIFSIEVPLGIITSLVGAPFFLSLLIQGGKR
ncbi:FecCD family ABC transporter permease, partial [Pasteurella multocida]|uniref:FecCD family ABC transporter permease n=1 Tax=Pasteurella multocida TaxID=747 RepID=UPI001B8B26EC